MDLDFSKLWGNSENSPADEQRAAEMPPQDIKPSNYTPNPQNAVQSTLDPTENNLIIEQARKIVLDYRQKREATEGIMQQIEQDIGKQDPLLLLLFAAEALDRLSGYGDGYIKRLEDRATAAGLTIGEYKHS